MQSDVSALVSTSEDTPQSKCPVCGTCFDSVHDITICDRCETPHHSQCWQYSEGCAIFGCKKSHKRFVTSEVETTQRVSEYSSQLCWLYAKMWSLHLQAANFVVTGFVSSLFYFVLYNYSHLPMVRESLVYFSAMLSIVVIVLMTLISVFILFVTWPFARYGNAYFCRIYLESILNEDGESEKLISFLCKSSNGDLDSLSKSGSNISFPFYSILFILASSALNSFIVKVPALLFALPALPTLILTEKYIVQRGLRKLAEREYSCLKRIHSEAERISKQDDKSIKK